MKKIHRVICAINLIAYVRNSVIVTIIFTVSSKRHSKSSSLTKETADKYVPLVVSIVPADGPALYKSGTDTLRIDNRCTIHGFNFRDGIIGDVHIE